MKAIVKYIIPILISTQLSAQVKTLDDYINIAIANSPILKDYYIQLQQNGIDSMIAGSAYKPQVNMNGTAIYAPTYGQFGYDEAISNGGAYEAVVSVTQQITPHKQITLTRMLSATERQTIASEAKVEEYDLRKEVTNDYLNTCLLQQQIIFYKQNDSFLAKQDETVKQLADRGSYKISDYYELLVEEKSLEAEIKELYLELTKSFSELNVACGITDTTPYKLSVPHIEPYKQNDIHQLAVYKKFIADSTKLAQQNLLVDAEYKPKLFWYADAGIEASQPNLIYRSFGNSLGLNLSVPIYDGHKRSLRHQTLKLSEDTRSGYEQFFIKNYTTRISLLAKQIDDENALAAQLRQEQKQVDHWISVNEAELSVGNISITDFLLSLKKNLEVKEALNEAVINQQLLQNEFNYWNH